MSVDPNGARAIFMTALDKSEPAERAAYLAQACGSDDALRKRVEVLLKANDDPGSFLEPPAQKMLATIDTPVSERPGTVIGPYKLLEQIGEGGFGVVFMAEQQQPVRRKVALKVIKAGMDSRQVIARFEAERQALALMDHPNIAKVHDGGETTGGRPYFVMELVKGVPLTTYCDDKRLTLRERLELFFPVCQAIQHAHQKGIIHRDIKPSNVLVGQYDGKPVPKVIDFGVAKATGPQLTEHTLVTGFGTVVGTLEYMSPEQAEVNQLDIDTRSDIYSLGVLLYELLTGTTPLTRQELKQAAFSEMLRLIREQEPPKPSTRLSDSYDTLPSISAQRQIEPAKLTRLVRGELDWIVMKALEKDRNRRYETANGFAQDVQRYLADEPVQACPPSAWYRCRKFARRNKAGLRITAVLLLTLAGVSWALWDQATRRAETSRRIAETEQTVNAALIQTQQWRKQAGDARQQTSPEADAVLALWGQAEVSLAQAETALRTGAADDRLRQRVLDEKEQIAQGCAQARRRAKLFRDLEEARMTGSTWIETHFDYTGAAVKYAAAFAAYGLEVKPERTDELARRIRAEEVDNRDALIVGLENWSYYAVLAKKQLLAKQLQALAGAADDDTWRPKFRAAATTRDAVALRALSSEARQLALPPSTLVLLARYLDAAGQHDECVALLRWGRARHPTDFWVHFELGVKLRMVPGCTPLENEEAIGCYRAALALHPTRTAVLLILGIALRDKNQLDEAIAEYKKAIDLDPNFAEAHVSLGVILCDYTKDIAGAIREFQTALKIEPDNAMAHSNLGNALLAKHDVEGAIREQQAALKIDPDFARARNGLGNALIAKNDVDGAIREIQAALKSDPNYAWAHVSLGGILCDYKKDFAGAICEFQAALKIEPNLAMAHKNLGNALLAQHDVDGAIREFQAALKIDPKDATAHFNLGIALKAKNQLDEAIAEYKKAIELDPKGAKAHCNLGIALWRKGPSEQAIIEYKKAIELDAKLWEAHNALGIALVAKNQLDEAIAEFKKAIELNPKYATAHIDLGNALKAKNQLDEAIAEFKKAIELDPKDVMARVSLGNALKAKNHLDEAIVEFKKAIDLNPKSAMAHYNLGNALGVKNDLDEAVAQFKMAIELRPDYAEAYCNLAFTLGWQGQLSASLDTFKRGHALGSKRQDWRYPSAQWVTDAERRIRLEAMLPDVLARKATPTDNRELLGLAEVCRLKRRHVAAERLYADAFTADPKLADDWKAGHRYNAACCAALAAAGQGTDADKLDDQEHRRLRQQALAWLRADLDAWSKRLESGQPAAQQLTQQKVQHWQRDRDLAGVRDEDALHKLPAQEQEAWRKLWADVAALLKEVGNAS